METNTHRRSWRLLADLGCYPPDITTAETHWIEAFEGVDPVQVEYAVRLWADAYAQAMTEDTRERSRASEHGRRWPSTAAIAHRIPYSAHRAPPTPRDISAGRWWPPTGSTAPVGLWSTIHGMSERNRQHREAGCVSAWVPDVRIPLLWIIVQHRYSADWPRLFDALVSWEPRCGTWCTIAAGPHELTGQAATMAAREGSDDPVVALLSLQEWHRREGAR